MIIGLTGGSGAGKSSVSRIFREMGMYTIDADLTARRVMEPGTECLMETIREFGGGVLKPDGTLNRKMLGDIVFHNPQSLQKLNCITHKYITQYIFEDIKMHPDKDVLIDGAVLIESGINRLCDVMISVLADEPMRIKRIMKRDGLSLEQASARIRAQKDDQFYIENSDFVIYNCRNGELPEEQVKEVARLLKEQGNTEKSIDS